jgi:hypothetical protein
MSYYIAPQSDNLMLGDIVIYRVVKRLKDFKAEDGVLYRVFKSKKGMESSMFIALYKGEDGKLKKQPNDFVWRF